MADGAKHCHHCGVELAKLSAEQVAAQRELGEDGRIRKSAPVDLNWSDTVDIKKSGNDMLAEVTEDAGDMTDIQKSVDPAPPPPASIVQPGAMHLESGTQKGPMTRYAGHLSENIHHHSYAVSHPDQAYAHAVNNIPKGYQFVGGAHHGGPPSAGEGDYPSSHVAIALTGNRGDVHAMYFHARDATSDILKRQQASSITKSTRTIEDVITAAIGKQSSSLEQVMDVILGPKK